MKNRVFGIAATEVHENLKKCMIGDGLPYVFDFEASKGSYIHDALSGKDILDCFGQFGSQALGYNHPRLKESKVLANAACTKIANSDLYSREMAAFVTSFCDQTLPVYFDKVFFIEGGSQAVENCLKIAFDWKARFMGWTDEQAQKLDIVHLKESFHGRGGYTLSLTNTGHNKTDMFPRFPWTRILNPKLSFPSDPEKIAYDEDISLGQAEMAMKRGNVAAVILEPIQGEGGNNMFRKSYFQALKDLCARYDALLIFDEVQTGFGASGKWWCHEHYGVAPDLMAFGKKSQVCGVAASPDRLNLIENNCFNTSGRINSTWGGNIVDMVRCKLIIDVVYDESLLSKVTKTGAYLFEELQTLAKKNMICNVRGLGTMIAFDLTSEEKRDRLIEIVRDKMLILRCGNKSIRFRPALTFGMKDAGDAIDFLEGGLKKLEK